MATHQHSHKANTRREALSTRKTNATILTGFHYRYPTSCIHFSRVQSTRCQLFSMLCLHAIRPFNIYVFKFILAISWNCTLLKNLSWIFPDQWISVKMSLFSTLQIIPALLTTRNDKTFSPATFPAMNSNFFYFWTLSALMRKVLLLLPFILLQLLVTGQKEWSNWYSNGNEL